MQLHRSLPPTTADSSKFQYGCPAELRLKVDWDDWRTIREQRVGERENSGNEETKTGRIQEPMWGPDGFAWARASLGQINTEHILSFFFCSRNILQSMINTRDSGCLARDEFLVIREGYHMLIFLLLGTVLHCTSWNGLFPVVNWLE